MKGMFKLTLASLRKDFRSLANPAKAIILLRFFKTGPGEYGEGDRFIGLMVPQIRRLVKRYRHLPLRDVESLIASPIHEERLCALLLLVQQFDRGDEKVRRAIFYSYLKHLRFVNNWDLVDLSAPQIVGGYLEKRSHVRLFSMAKSKHLWTRRVAMLACFFFIQRGSCESALRVAEILVTDKHDLIHKSVGWMLREVGKRCSMTEEEVFLKKHFRTMPRTMLRYAIERFPKEKRLKYLRG